MMKNIFLLLTFLSFNCVASDLTVYTLTLKNHRFSPDKITVKAGEKFKLAVVNLDNSFEEFESKKLAIEKFVNPKGKLNLVVGPLKPGSYDFFGEFHMKTAQGTLIAE